MQVVRVNPAHAVGFIVDRGLAADWAADVHDFELLPDLAVGVRDDVRGVRVDAQEAGDLRDDSGLFLALADRTLGRVLADVLGAAGQGPLAGVAASLEEDGALVVDHEHVAGGDEGVGLGGLGVVVVLGPAHGGCYSCVSAPRGARSSTQHRNYRHYRWNHSLSSDCCWRSADACWFRASGDVAGPPARRTR